LAICIFGGQTLILKTVPVYLASRDHGNASEFIIIILARTIILSGIFLVIILSSVLLLDKNLPDIIARNPALPFLSLSVPLLAANVILSHALQVTGRITLAFFTSGLSHSLLFVAALSLFRPDTLFLLSLIYFSVSILVFCHLVYLMFEQLKAPSLSSALQRIGFGSSFQFFIVQISLDLLVQLPIIWLGVVGSSPAQVSGYAVASRVALTLNFIYAVVNRIASPLFSRHHSAGNLLEMRREFFKAVVVMSSVAVPLAFFLLFFATPILSLFGEEFTQFSTTLYALVLLQTVNVLTGPAGNLLLMSGRQVFFRNLVLVGLLVVLVLSLILVPKYEAFGAALAMCAGYGFVNIASFCFVAMMFFRKKWI
jgi:O-antigen/teichoic acid export membrane protein